MGKPIDSDMLNVWIEEECSNLWAERQGALDNHDWERLRECESCMFILGKLKNKVNFAPPTAYDVNKVVEQMEEFREEARQFGVDGMLTDIIEIVKRGGLLNGTSI